MSRIQTPTPAWDVYSTELFQRGHGYPLWDPQPTKHGEVLIGDVGYLYRGAFFRLFNPTRPLDDSANAGLRVPNESAYKPLTLDEEGLHVRPDALPGNSPICSRSVQSFSASGQVGAQNATAGLSFQCSEERGAFLVIKDSADRTEYHRTRRMMNYMKANIDAWHEFVTTELDRDLRHEEIMFVNGYTKTKDWAVAAFMHQGRSTGLQLQVDVGSTANASFSFTSSRDASNSVDHHVGPSLASSGASATTPYSSSSNLASAKSQCIFINYFKMRTRRFWFRRIEAAAGPHELPEHDGLEEGSAVGIDTDSVSDVEQVPEVPKAYDPVGFILDYILEHSDAEVAIASDTDIVTLCSDKGIPSDIPAFLMETQPPIEVNQDGLGMLNLEHAAAIQAIPAAQPGAAGNAGAGSRPSTEDKGKVVEGRTGNQDAQVVLENHTGGVCALAYSPNGRYVASGSEDMNVIIWDVTTGQRHQTCISHTDTVCTLAFSPDSTELVSGARDGKAVVWSVATGVARALLEGHDGFVYSLAWSPDGRTIVTASLDYTISWWDASAGSLIRQSTEHAAMILLVVFSPDGRRLISAGADQSACLWDTATGTLLNRLVGHEGMIYTAEFDQENRRVITGSEDGSARIWSADTGDEWVIIREHAGAVWAASFSPDGRQAYSAASDGTVCVCNSFSGDRLNAIEDRDSVVNSAAFSPDCKKVCTSSGDNSIKVWDTSNGQCLITLQGHSDKVNNLRFSPDGIHIASSSDDTTVRLWNLRALHVA